MGLKKWFYGKKDNSFGNGKATLSETPDGQMLIPIKQLPAECNLDRSKLIEIKDSCTLQRINALVPGLAMVGIHAQNAQQLSKGLYEVILDSGFHLVGRKDGLLDPVGRNAIGGKDFAKLKKADTSYALRNISATAMQAAAMVVGQYYMTQINRKLTDINTCLTNLHDFSMNEYRGKIISLVTQIRKISDFQAEILMDENLKERTLKTLQEYEVDCSALLQQANMELNGMAIKIPKDYATYENSLFALAEWLEYQRLLVEMLYEIGRLSFIINLGGVSREHCFYTYKACLIDAESAQKTLAEWHSLQIKRFGIDVETQQRNREGIEALVGQVLKIVDQKLEYQHIPDNAALMLKKQSTPALEKLDEKDDSLFSEKVRIIAKDGKMYFYCA